MHQSGTHWLKHMLASAIASQLQLPPPKYAYAGDMIGGHKDPVSFPGIPLFGHSHNIPSPLIGWRAVRSLVGLPRYVLLARDLRAMLVSHYEKYRHEYDCSFTEYLRGDISNQRFESDIWWCIRFQNAWGRVLERYPQDCLLIRYEDLTAAPLPQLEAINAFLGLGLTAAALQQGIADSGKAAMRSKPMKAEEKIRQPHNRIVVREGGRGRREYFTVENEAIFQDICRRYLHHDFGYDYRAPDMAGNTPGLR